MSSLKFALLLFVCLCLAAGVHASTFEVNSPSDLIDTSPGDGVCHAVNDTCTLRAAVMEANAHFGADAITFSTSWTIDFHAHDIPSDNSAANLDLDITEDLTITGSFSILPRYDTGSYIDRFFDIHPGVTVTISHFVTQSCCQASGRDNGGYIRNAGTLTLFNCALQQGVTRQAPVARGGALFNTGTVTLTKCRFNANYAQPVSPQSNLEAYGGAIWNEGTVIATETKFQGNYVTATVDSGFSAVVAGGAIASSPTGIVSISGSAFDFNFGSAAVGRGGAITGGATVQLTNVTFARNRASTEGGAVYRDGATQLTSTNCTFSDNFAPTGGALYHADPGATAGALRLHNTIVDRNNRYGTGPDCYSTTPITSLGYNLISSNSDCNISSGAGDKIGVDARLSELLVRIDDSYYRPLPQSPAIDAGDPVDPPAIDQRRLPRSIDGDGDGTRRADIGAIELTRLSKRGDFDLDGRADVFWRHAASGDNYLWRMNGSSFTAEPVWSVGDTGWQIVAMADFSGDGKSDLFWRHATNGDSYLWTMNGSTLVSAVAATSFTNTAWKILGSGDFNGDGHADLVWRNGADGQIYVWLMEGPTLLSAVAAGNRGADWRYVGAGDFNDDGIEDMVWNQAGTGVTDLWMMLNGKPIQFAEDFLSPPHRGEILGFGDVGGDGVPDLIVRTPSGDVWFQLNTRNLVQSPYYNPYQQFLGNVGDKNWQVVAFGDFNGDGALDLFWRHATGGWNYVWLVTLYSTTQAPVYTVSDPDWRATGPR